MTAPARITYRSVPGQFNAMAVCAACDRDATQTQMTHFVEHAVSQTPLLCDDCREPAL